MIRVDLHFYERGSLNSCRHGMNPDEMKEEKKVCFELKKDNYTYGKDSYRGFVPREGIIKKLIYAQNNGLKQVESLEIEVVKIKDLVVNEHVKYGLTEFNHLWYYD